MNLTNEHLTRQLDIVPIGILGTPITIIGAGAIGGWTTLALAKMGFANLRVFDFDTVDTVNMNSQFYRFKDIGKPKVLALKDLVTEFTNINIEAVHDKYTRGVFPGIVISAVDSMRVRKTIWENHMGKSPFTKVVIDPRMGAEEAHCYVSNPMSIAEATRYEKTLYDDSEALQEPCTRRATAYCALGVSAIVCSQVKTVLTGSGKQWSTQWAITKGAMLSYTDR